MIFQDFTIVSGGIYSRRQQNTRTLAPEALAVCRRMLTELRRGEILLNQPVEELPPFDVTLGPPEWLRETMGESVEAAGRFFCCALPGLPPFQVNVVLPRGAVTKTDERAVATLLALSLGGKPPPPDYDTDRAVQAITEARPVLATTLMGSLGTDMVAAMQTVQVAADFCTCFAAVLLQEP